MIARILLPAAFFLLLLSACRMPEKAFVEACRKNAQVILPDYIRYVEKDENLDENSKRIRIQTAKDWHALIEQAAEAVKEK